MSERGSISHETKWRNEELPARAVQLTTARATSRRYRCRLKCSPTTPGASWAPCGPSKSATHHHPLSPSPFYLWKRLEQDRRLQRSLHQGTRLPHRLSSGTGAATAAATRAPGRGPKLDDQAAGHRVAASTPTSTSIPGPVHGGHDFGPPQLDVGGAGRGGADADLHD